MTMQSITAGERWLYSINSQISLNSVSLSDMMLPADPGLIESTKSVLVWKEGVLKNIWTTGQSLMNVDNTNITLEVLTVSRYNATFLANRRGLVKVNNCTFVDGGLYLRETSTLLRVNGGLLSCSGCISVSITNITAHRLSAVSGGVLFIVFSKKGSVEVLNSFFIGCFAVESGGALHSQQAMLYSAGNWFEGNEAQDGGAISLSCRPTTFYCSSFVGFSVFRRNNAVNGGAVHWHENRPTFYKNAYMENSAVYGPDEASAASRLGLIDVATLQPIVELDYEGIPGQRVPIPLLIGLIDNVGQLIATDNTSYVNIRDNAYATFFGSTRLIAVNGIANYSAFIIKAIPGSTLLFEAFSGEISALETNYERHSSFVFKYSLRKCIPGEHTEIDTCYICPKTSYSLSPSQNCTACPSSATCPGGTAIVLDPGFWRSSQFSDRIESCFVKEACEGGANARCSKGFESNLCGVCAPGYYRVGKFSCFECGSHALLFTRIGFLEVFYLTMLGFMVYFSLSDANTTTKNAVEGMCTLIKILISFTQSMMLISGLKTEWNDSVLRMFELMEIFGTVVVGAFAPECYLHHISSIPIVYLTLIIASFGVVLLVFLLEALKAIIRTCRLSMRLEVITAVEVIVLFLLQPIQLKYAINLLSCMTLDTGTWLIAYMSEKCWEGQHRLYALALALPTLVIFGIGVFGLFLFILFSKSFKSHVAMRYFVIGLKESAYYWDLVSHSLKLALAVSVPSLIAASTKVQVLAATIIVFFALYLNAMNQPYSSAQINRVNIFSIATVYAYLILAFYTHYFIQSAPVLKDVLSFVSFLMLFLFLVMWLLSAWKSCRKRVCSTIPPEASFAELPVPNNSVLQEFSISQS